ncbi:MAG TPA: Rid family detoxifying hydrolase [bacterium]|jgi:2-iminobutanoate/2-iminopropanoate deaminase|nr:Rid family detoxifying hydrolase [bacterium]
MPKEAVLSAAAPAPLGPYSQAIKVGPLLFCSGQLGLDAAGNKVGSSVSKETEQALENLKAVIEAAGARMDQVVKTTVYLTDMEDFKFMNQVYEKYFPGIPPARSTVGILKLPKSAKVEIEAIVVIA